MLFNVWIKELEVYLGQDDNLAVFMAGGHCSEWEAYDANPNRITEPAGEDEAQHLPVRRRQLRTILSIVAKSCDIHHYNIVNKHSTYKPDMDLHQAARGLQYPAEGNTFLQPAGPPI